MFVKFISSMPILAESTDSLLKRADIVFNVVVPIAIIIMLVGAIFGKKDK